MRPLSTLLSVLCKDMVRRANWRWTIGTFHNTPLGMVASRKIGRGRKLEKRKGGAYLADGGHKFNPVVPAQTEVDGDKNLCVGGLNNALGPKRDEQLVRVGGDVGEEAEISQGALPGHERGASLCTRHFSVLYQTDHWNVSRSNRSPGT